MEKYYCNQCSRKRGYLNTESLAYANFTGNTYMLEKFVKHTLTPSTTTRVTSTYCNPSYEAYKDNIRCAIASGSTMFDNKNRKNVILYAYKTNGLTFLNKVSQGQTNVVKVVFPDNASKIHSFPVKSNYLITKTCELCRINVLTGGTVTSILGQT